MKNLLLLFLAIILSTTIFAQNVNIPDANFKAALVGNSAINTNMDTEIQTSEAAAFTGTINVVASAIADLTGIEAFTSLTSLDCGNNSLTSLNVSANTALTNLYCYNNQLTSLNVSTNTSLTYLVCDNNQLTSLAISTNTALTTLSCYNNQLTSLDVSTNTALTTLNCYNNQLTSLNVSANTALTYLVCSWNQLTGLNVSANTALTNLYCENNQLTSLNVSTNTALYELYCGNNQLTNLIINAPISSLECSNNQLTCLNIIDNSVLFYNSLSTLNNPNLSCIQISDTTIIYYYIDSWTSTSTNCNNACSTIGIKEQDFLSNVILSPNPTKSTFVLAVTSSKNAVLNMNLTNSLGQVVLSHQSNLNIGLNEVNFDIQNQPSGIYFMSINYENNHLIKKIIKQ